MNKWLIVHSLESYAQNPKLIGFAAKTRLDGSIVRDKKGNPVPSFKTTERIKAGDKIVYYCKGDYVIKGIYEVGKLQYEKEEQWPDTPLQFEIIPILELDIPYDFRPLISSLDLFKGISDPRRWGLVFMGMNNSIKSMTDNDYEIIEKSLIKAKQQEGQIDIEGDDQLELPNYRQHLLVQHQISEWGIKNGHRVHVAINDRNKIKENLPELLDDIPKFHEEGILEIAKWIDVLFFDREREFLTHAFEVEHTPTMYSGLLRLNDIAERYPYEKTKYYIISDDKYRMKFDQELDRPSFYMLRQRNCTFRNYKEVDKEWRNLKNRRTPIF